MGRDPGPEGAGAGRDDVLEALDVLVEVIRDATRRNQQVLRRAQRIRRMRAKGCSYREIVTRDSGPLIVELMRLNVDGLLEAGSRLRRSEARVLHDEGLTMEQIAELFGVTRQRVSALLRAERRAASASVGRQQATPA